MFSSIMVLLAISAGLADEPADQEAPELFNLKVISDTVPDITSTEALLKEIIKPGMSDQEKATAVWQVVYHSRFWNPSSRGNLRAELGGTDPIITMNCFSPTICQEDAENCIALWGLLGYSARMWQLGWHTTPEIWYGDRWRHFDATVGRITRDANGEIGSVTLDQEAGGAARRNWMRPESYISASESISLGQRMGLTVRPGETFTRYWYPLGKTGDYWCVSSDGKRPDNRIRKNRRRLADAMKLTTRRFEPMPDDAAYGNGRWCFQPDFSQGNWRALVEDSQNIKIGPIGEESWTIHPAEAGKEAWVTFRIRSPYVLSGGYVSGMFSTAGRGDVLEVQASADRGCTWKSLLTKDFKGTKGRTLGLRDVIGGKFECLVKFRMLASADPQDVWIGELEFESFTMNNPFMLPALRLGKTTVTVDAGPQLDTVGIHPNVSTPEYRACIVEEKNTISSSEADGPDWLTGLLCKEPGKESYVIFKVSTPGEMKWLRWGGMFVDNNETSKLFYSFDGKEWTEKPWSYTQRAKDEKNTLREQVSLYEVLDKFPKGAKEVWLKYWFFRPEGAKEGTLLLTPGIRIDADYVPAVRGKRPPVEVTYCWNQYEGGVATEKTHTKVIDEYPTKHGIIVKGDQEPTMKWVQVRLKTPEGAAAKAASQPATTTSRSADPAF